MLVTIPIDVSGISEELPDPGHERIRAAVLSAVQLVWTEHEALVVRVTSLEDAVTTLTAQVAALTPPPVPTQPPAP